MPLSFFLILLAAQQCYGSSKWQVPLGTGTGPYQTAVEWTSTFSAMYPDEVEFQASAVGSGSSQDALLGDVDCAKKYRGNTFLCGSGPVVNATPFGMGGAPFDDDWYSTYADMDLQLMPILIGPIVVAYGKDVTGNLGSATDSQLNLSLPLLADIFGGRCTYWDDSRIQRLNPAITLPHERITVVVRSDKSGMSNSFTKVIDHFSPWWSSVPGFGSKAVRKKPKWPLSNYSDPQDPYFVALEGMSALVVHSLRVPFSITYIDLAESKRFSNFLGSAHIVNNYTQEPVPVTPETLMNAMDAYIGKLHEPGSRLAVDPLDPRRNDAYPIARFIYHYVKKSAKGNGDCYRTWLVSEFLKFTYTESAFPSADKNGWAIAPASVSSIVKEHIASMRCLHPESGVDISVSDYAPPRRRLCPAGQFIQPRPGGEGIFAFSGCGECPAGRYLPKSDRQFFSCLQCPAGRASNETGRTECTLCPPGTAQTREGAFSCETCPAGSYADKVGSSQCSSCSLGMIAASNGSIRCNFCDYGQFAERFGSISCASCPAGMSTPDRGAESPDKCGCPADHYLAELSSGGVSCLPCPEGTTCKGFGASVLVAKGYFMPEDSPRNSERLNVFKCRNEVVCPGQFMAEAQICGPHRFGLNCAKCKTGYSETPESLCEPCDAFGSSALPILIVLLQPVMMALHYYWNRKGAQVEAVEGGMLSLTLGTAVPFVQSLGLFSTLTVEWPPMLEKILDFLNVFLFDLSGLGVGCLLPTNVWTTYGIEIAFPLVVALYGASMVPISFCMHGLTGGRFGKFHWPEVTSTVGLIGTSFYIGVCTATLSLIDCYSGPNEVPVARSMPFLICRGSEYFAAMPIFVLGVLIYLIAVTSLMAFALFVAPRRFESLNFRKAIRFLTFKFRPGAWWYSLVLNMRAFAMAMVTVVFPDDTSWQLLTMIVILTMSLWMHGMMRAYSEAIANRLESMEMLGLALLAMLAAVGQQGEHERTHDILSICILGVVVLACIVINGWAFLLGMRPKLAKELQQKRASTHANSLWNVCTVVASHDKSLLQQLFEDTGTFHEFDSISVISEWMLHEYGAHDAKRRLSKRSRSSVSSLGSKEPDSPMSPLDTWKAARDAIGGEPTSSLKQSRSKQSLQSDDSKVGSKPSFLSDSSKGNSVQTFQSEDTEDKPAPSEAVVSIRMEL